MGDERERERERTERFGGDQPRQHRAPLKRYNGASLSGKAYFENESCQFGNVARLFDRARCPRGVVGYIRARGWNRQQGRAAPLCVHG